jgi:hypothetical protein
MNTSEVFRYELASLLERVGGAKAIAMLAILAALTAILPLRFGAGLLDPLLLLVYSTLAPLLAGSFMAQSFASERARSSIVSDDDPAQALATGKVLAATAWGFACWVVLMAVPLIALNWPRRHLLLPPVLDLLALALFAAALAWFASALGSIFASGVTTPSSAQSFVRGMILIPLLLLASALSVLPLSVRTPLARSIGPGHLPLTLGAASLLLIAAGWPAVRKTASRIEDLRHPLSILEP